MDSTSFTFAFGLINLKALYNSENDISIVINKF